MTSAADRARAKAARLAAAGRPDVAEDAEEQAPARVRVVPPVSAKPIRISLDLAPALFDQLTEWRTRAARQLGRGRVTNADTLRVLVRTLLSDEELTARVVTTLRQEANS